MWAQVAACCWFGGGFGFCLRGWMTVLIVFYDFWVGAWGFELWLGLLAGVLGFTGGFVSWRVAMWETWFLVVAGCFVVLIVVIGLLLWVCVNLVEWICKPGCVKVSWGVMLLGCALLSCG